MRSTPAFTAHAAFYCVTCSAARCIRQRLPVPNQALECARTWGRASDSTLSSLVWPWLEVIYRLKRVCGRPLALRSFARRKDSIGE
jgi:hypothetical protein